MPTYNEVKAKINKFNVDRDWDQFHSLDNLAKSISIEANELLECFQWSSDDYDKNSVCEELADVVNYCIQMSEKLKVDLWEIVDAKIEKNAIKYPIDKSKGKSDKYNKI